jgi:hypothetical protein
MALWQRAASNSPTPATVAGASLSAPPPGAAAPNVTPARATKRTWGVNYQMPAQTGFQTWYGYKGNKTVPHEDNPRQQSEPAGF